MKINEAVTYAQNREDIIIDAFLKSVKKGFYVDVGAGHHKEHSVTKLFYDKGWRGINVEPEPKMFKLLEQNRHRDTNLKIGLSSKPGRLVMRQYLGWRSGLSTFSQAMMEENSAIDEYVDVETAVTTLGKILDEQKVKHIDFMKIDVEGYEQSVLEGNNWQKYRPSLICIEANHVKEDWDKLLQSVDYKEVFFDGLNRYYLAKEAMSLLDTFSYGTDVASKTVVNYRNIEKIDNLNRHLEQLSGDMASLKSENLRLQREIIDQKRLISLAKQLVKSSDSVIRARLERLNKPKGTSKKTYSATLEDLKNRDDLFQQIRLSDLNNYYTNTYRKDRLAYRVLAGGYDSFSRAGFRVGKISLGVLRKVKHD